MQKIKSLLVFFLILAILPIMVSAKEIHLLSEYSAYDYYFDSYDINIVVNENNTLDITEKLGVQFNVAKHGIYRKIPLKNTVVRNDGTTSKNRAQISNINVSDTYTVTNQDGYKVIKIGDASSTITGQKDYTISYTYNLGKDPSEDYDELYFNLIGAEWDTFIDNITFTITMPKEFDASKLGFSSGVVGSTDSSNITYNVDGNVITGNYIGTLYSNNALTVRLELPEGYFVNAGLKINPVDYIAIGLPLIFLAISIYFWYKFGRDDEVVETVEFYPPEGFNSLEVGFLYKGAADSQDVTSLLIYLANKGYLKISETEEKSLFSKKKGFKLTKLKEYDGDNQNEKIFLDGLFNAKSSYSIFGKNAEESNDSMNEVTSEDLYNNFYIVMNRILRNVNDKTNKNKIFEKSASGKTKFIALMVIITFCLITIPPIYYYGDMSTIIFALLFPGAGFFVLCTLLFGNNQTVYVNGKPNNSSIVVKLFGLIWGLGFAGVPWFLFVYPALKQEPLYLITYFVGLACVFGMLICINYLPKRTQYGNEILGKLKGFKNFLETAEKDQLEAQVMQNPTYFYNILPFTYVLGVSKKWISKFETINMQAPSWYDGPDAFDMVTFSDFIYSTMSSAQSSMSSSPSSSDGSGGGSSGGGSGGGGGGSW